MEVIAAQSLSIAQIWIRLRYIAQIWILLMATFMPPAGSPAKMGNEVMKFKIMTVPMPSRYTHHVYGITPNQSLCNVYIQTSVLAKYAAQLTHSYVKVTGLRQTRSAPESMHPSDIRYTYVMPETAKVA